MGTVTDHLDAIGREAPPGTLAASGTCTGGRDWYAFMKISGLHVGDVLQVKQDRIVHTDVIERGWVSESEAVLWRPR